MQVSEVFESIVDWLVTVGVRQFVDDKLLTLARLCTVVFCWMDLVHFKTEKLLNLHFFETSLKFQ